MKDEKLSDKVVKYIMTRKDADFGGLTVNEIADAFGIDRFRLSRVFKAEKEKTLEAYLCQERMMRCAHLLISESQMTVRDISELIGFCTCDYFNQVFKRHFGITPGQFRQCKTKRTGQDRRHTVKDRRRNLRGPLPVSGDRRAGQKDRRRGPSDRRTTGEPDNFEAIPGNVDKPASPAAPNGSPMKSEQTGHPTPSGAFVSMDNEKT